MAVGIAAVSLNAGGARTGAARIAGAAPARAALAHFETGTAPNLPAPQPITASPKGVENVDNSYNWSGYVDTSTTDQYFTKVAGSWTVTAVSCTPEDRIVSVWVGIDGWSHTDPTVEQLGVSAQCYEGTPYYYSWYEMYPNGTVEVGSKVQPGDKITASVTRSGTKYAMNLTDATTAGNNISTNQTCALATCLDTSAEWVVERPEYSSTGVVPLAQFAPIAFTGASAVGGGTSGPITAFTDSAIQMKDSTDTYNLNTTGALNAAGKGFSDTWLNSY